MATVTASSQRFSLRGDKKFLRAVAKLANPELKALNKRALARAGRRIIRRAQTGYLSGSPLNRITWELFNSVIATSRHPAEFITIGSPLDQAMPLHFGWPAHNMKPRPWLFPAADDEFPRLSDIWIDEMSRAVGSVS